MESFSQFCDSLPSLSDPLSPPSESTSNFEGVFSGRRLNFSDEEVMLASCHSKKRSGRKKFKETRHPVYRGVRERNSGKWVCELREPNKKTRIWLGTFPSAEMAARAHDVAAIALRGRSACLNFADSLWRLPIPASGEVKDIQEAATLAAEKFRPSISEVVVKERTVGLPENVILIDEDVDSLWLLLTDPSFSGETSETTVEERTVFEMPELLANIAEGVMLCPPEYVADGYYGSNDMEFGVDMSLWSYSM